MAPIRVTWSFLDIDSPLVKVSYPNGASEVVPLEDLHDNLPRGANVHTYYRDGPFLLGHIVDIRDQGKIDKGVLRPYLGSHPFTRTEISGTAEKTMRLWVDRTPESLIDHPAFDRLCPYLPFGMTGAVADLITTIFDPRWYSDHHRPNRWSRIEQAFALSPRGDRSDCARRAVIRGCWVAPDSSPGLNNVAADYFGRKHAALLASGMSEEVAVRKTGKQLIRAVVAAWLNSDSGGDPLFDPSRLFDAEAVAATKQ